MIFQGLFNIIDLYFEEINEFYNQIDVYFNEKINVHINKKNIGDLTYRRICVEITKVLKEELMHIGFNLEKIENYFLMIC